MKHDRIRPAGLPAPVLRNVVIQNQPHALLRPGTRVAALPVAKASQAVHQASAPLSAAPPEPTYQEGLSRGYERGYAEGQAAALQEAQQELQKGDAEARQRAVQQGLRDGYQKGLEQAAAEGKQALEDALQAARTQEQERLVRIESLLAALPAQLEARLLEAEDDMLALCHEVLCTILGQTAAGPDALRPMLHQLLAQMRTQGTVKVHLHPDDCTLLQEAPVLAGLAGIEWVADPQIELGGLILRSAHGSLDARLEVQLANLRAALLAVRAERRSAQAREK